MAARKAFALRIDPKLFEEVRRWADADFRSVNGQIEFLLQRAVRERKKSRGPGPGSSDDSES
jgi:hypothetical protein